MRKLLIPAWLLVLLIIAAWIASYFGSNTIFYVGGGRAMAVDSFGGELSLWAGSAGPGETEYGRKFYPPTFSWTPDRAPVTHPDGIEWWLAGFGVTSRRRFPCAVDTPTHVTGLMAPYWFLALGSAALAVTLSRRYSTKNLRRREGLCLACGYDIRASADRCPECGATIAGSITAARRRKNL